MSLQSSSGGGGNRQSRPHCETGDTILTSSASGLSLQPRHRYCRCGYWWEVLALLLSLTRFGEPHHCIDLNNYELRAHCLTAVSVCMGHQRASSAADCVSQVPFHPVTARLWSLSYPYPPTPLPPHSTFPVTRYMARFSLNEGTHAHYSLFSVSWV